MFNNKEFIMTIEQATKDEIKAIDLFPVSEFIDSMKNCLFDTVIYDKDDDQLFPDIVLHNNLADPMEVQRLFLDNLDNNEIRIEQILLYESEPIECAKFYFTYQGRVYCIVYSYNNHDVTFYVLSVINGTEKLIDQFFIGCDYQSDFGEDYFNYRIDGLISILKSNIGDCFDEMDQEEAEQFQPAN